MGSEDFQPPPLPTPPGRSWRLIVILLAIFILLPGFLWMRCGWLGCPNVDRLTSYQPGKASKLLDRQGKLFAVLSPAQGQAVPLEKIPKYVVDAFIAIEDKRFYKHDGVDWRRVLGAIFANVKKGEIDQGFSTITMQLARSVFPDQLPVSKRTLWRKLLEIRVAGEIEDRFTKNEIMELYLGHVYFGNGTRGISTASQYYFGKSVDQLKLSQGAMLAAMLKGPALFDPRRHPDAARKRRNMVIDLMQEQGLITKRAARSSKDASLGVVRRRGPASGPEPLVGSYFVEEVRRQLEDQFGERLYVETLTILTTLDFEMQQAAEAELQRQLSLIESGRLGSFKSSEDQLQGAIVALQSETGDVLTWVGGRDYTQSRYDRVKNAYRQIGSAFKPFVYAAALENDHVLSEYIPDQPLQVKLDSGQLWEPKNFDNRMEGQVTIREALVRSKNIPTVYLGKETGLEKIKDLAHDAGIESEIQETPALPLGTPALTPLEVATAYIPFASLGEAVEPRMILKVEDTNREVIWKAEKPKKEKVLDEGVAFLVTHVLQETIDRGTAAAVRKYGFYSPAAGKTGTTNNATDTWFVGYTPKVVLAVWVGFDQPRPIMPNATSSRLAVPIWARIMQRSAIAKSRTPGWVAPDNIVSAWVDPASGQILKEGCSPSYGMPYRELFLSDNMPDEICPSEGVIVPAKEEQGRPPADEEEARVFDLFPDSVFGRSRPAPAEELEEAERPKKERFLKRGRGHRKHRRRH